MDFIKCSQTAIYGIYSGLAPQLLLSFATALPSEVIGGAEVQFAMNGRYLENPAPEDKGWEEP